MTDVYIVGIIVTYHPNPIEIVKLAESISTQVDKLFIIDNASPNFSDDIGKHLAISNLTIIYNNENLGLGTVYNQGIERAKLHGASHLILFDQDSLPAPDMVNCLLKELLTRNKTSLTTAAAGPKYYDIKGQQLSPFVKIKGFHLKRVYCGQNEVVEVDHLISSGSLIDMRAFDIVGYFTENLFIDYIDTEWCLRTRSSYLIIIGVGSATMKHSIGDAFLTVFGRQLPLHSTTRLYYQFRNQTWLMIQPWVGWRWRIIDLIRCLKLIAVYAVFVPNRLKNLSVIAKAIKAGLIKKMGKLKDAV